MTQVEVPISLTAFGYEPRPATAAGIILAVKRAREERRLTQVRGACPRCGKAPGSLA